MSKITLIGFPESTLTTDVSHCIALSEILHPDKFLNDQYDQDSEFLVTVMQDKNLRQKIVQKLDSQNLKRATYIHPSAIVDSTAQIGEGTFVAPFASVFFQASVGKDCIIGPYSMVSHRSVLGRSVVMHPYSVVAGSSTLGDYCLLGLRSTVIDKINICSQVVVGAGSMITKNIDHAGTYVGSPARKTK
jgi:sugar O-acyltransferase (sialic acid O-acetyltransferase NeuD family)